MTVVVVPTAPTGHGFPEGACAHRLCHLLRIVIDQSAETFASTYQQRGDFQNGTGSQGDVFPEAERGEMRLPGGSLHLKAVEGLIQFFKSGDHRPCPGGICQAHARVGEKRSGQLKNPGDSGHGFTLGKNSVGRARLQLPG